MKRSNTIAMIVLGAFVVGWILFRASTARPGDRSSLGPMVVEFMPVILAAAIALFLHHSNDRQRAGVGLSLVLPGLGHLVLGHKQRGLFLMALIVPTFLAGMVLADFANISPFDRHPIWGLAQLPGGVMTVLAWLATTSVKITRDNPYYAIGCLFSGVACLLNVIAMCDIWDLEEKPDPSKSPKPAAPPPPAGSAAT